MGEAPSDHAINFEGVKVSLRQDKDGFKLTLAVHPDEVPEELMWSWVGARYMVAMVLLDEQDRPISKKPSSGFMPERDDRVQYAVALCKEPMFHAWLMDKGFASAPGEDRAKVAIYEHLGIISRSELRDNLEAQQGFDALVRQYRKDVGLD